MRLLSVQEHLTARAEDVSWIPRNCMAAQSLVNLISSFPVPFSDLSGHLTFIRSQTYT